MEGSSINFSRSRASWSRRRFVAQAVTLAAAAPALVRAIPRAVEPPPDLSTRKAPGDAAKDSAAGSGSGLVRSAGVTDNRLTTVVYINGAGPYRVLVDTGAETTLLATEIATQLALTQRRPVMVEGIAGRHSGFLVEVASLRMGSLVCSNLEVPVLPRTMLGVDGYLGLDVLDQHRVVLDFAAETLTVTKRQGFFAALWERSDETIVRTLGSSGRLRASNCMVNGVRADAFVDTGAEVSVMNPALYAALQQRSAIQHMVGGEVELSGVTGGTVSGLAVDVDHIVLGELNLTYTPLVVAPLEVFDIWGLGGQPALLFGMDCLRRFRRVSIDYGRKELRFELANARLTLPLQAELPPPLAG